MKKILTILLGMVALPAAATFYSGNDSYSSKSGSSDSAPSSYNKSAGGDYDDDGNSASDFWQRYRKFQLDQATTRTYKRKAPSTDNSQKLLEAFKKKQREAARKLAEKRDRNAAYGGRGSKSAGSGGSGSKFSKGSGGSKYQGSSGSRKDQGKGSKGSRGDWSGGGSRGSKGGGSSGKGNWGKGKWWLDREDKRERQLEAFTKILQEKFEQSDKFDKWDDEFGKDFWTHKEFQKALLCWLAPHLHEDQKWVNRNWSKLSKKIWWWLKHHKDDFPKDKPDPPSEVPVPPAMFLFGSAVLGLGAIRRRRSGNNGSIINSRVETSPAA